MNTTVCVVPPSRRRRRHSPEFKARVIAACLQPGVSVAAVALANGLSLLDVMTSSLCHALQAVMPARYFIDRQVESVIGTTSLFVGSAH